MTKVQAIVRVLEANGGCATLSEIYQQIEQFYPGAKAAADWQAGIRGVLYREIRNGKTFVKIDGATYGLKPSGIMNEKTFAALEKIMGAIGSVENGEIYLYDPHAQKPGMYTSFGLVYAWMDNAAKQLLD